MEWGGEGRKSVCGSWRLAKRNAGMTFIKQCLLFFVLNMDRV